MISSSGDISPRTLLRAAVTVSLNTVYLSRERRGFPADEWCAAVVRVFDLVDGHFAFDDSGVGAVGAGGE